MKRICLAFIAVCLIMTSSMAAGAAAWTPTKEIRVMIPYNAGGQNDIIARKIAGIIQQRKLLPVTMLVVNMPGGATRECLTEVNKAAPDGSTLLLHQTALLAAEALKQVPYNLDSFTTICGIVEFQNLLSVRGDSPWKDINDVIADAKKEPGKIRIAIPGVGGTNHFSLLNFLVRAKLKDAFKLIPTTGGAPAAAAVMGRQVEMRCTGAPDLARFMRAGEEKPMVILDVKPNPEFFPGVPDLKSAFGITKGVVTRMGFFGPPKMPKEVVDTLTAAIKAAAETEEFKTFCREQMGTPVFDDGPAWAAKHREDARAMAEIVSEIK